MFRNSLFAITDILRNSLYFLKSIFSPLFDFCRLTYATAYVSSTEVKQKKKSPILKNKANYARCLILFCSVQNYTLQTEAFSKTSHEKRLSSLVYASSGSSIDLPMEAKAQAMLYPISQQLNFTNRDIIFEQGFTEEKPDGTAHQYHKKYYISLHTAQFTLPPNSASIVFTNPSCTIKFASLNQAQEAYSLFQELQKEAFNNPPSHTLPSEIAKNYGYTYLIVSPRGESFHEMIDLIKTSSQTAGTFPNLWCWLSKQPIDDPTAYLNEGTNRLPLFIYPLSVLDTSEFFLTANFSGTQVLYTDLHTQKIQSGTSLNPLSMHEFLKTAHRTNIVFQKCPDLSSPLQIYISHNQRGHASRLNFPSSFSTKSIPTKFIKPLYEIERPLGTNIKWVKGKSYYSSDSLIYALSSYSFSDLVEFLEFEYPFLSALLHHSRTSTDKTGLSHTIMSRARLLDTQLTSTKDDLFTRIALIAYELGTPFGPHTELKLNGYPFLLSLLEQTGLHKTHGPIIEWYYTHKIPQNTLSTLFHIDRLSYLTFLPREVVLQALTTLEIVAGNHQSSLKSLQSCVKKTKIYFSGRAKNAPHFPLRQLFSSYYWEKQDPLHHSGYFLAKLRNEFETEILLKPHSSKFGHFFKWLSSRTKNKPSTCYLGPSERGHYIAKFKDNTIISPQIPFPSNQVLFVVDEAGTIYLGVKDEGSAETKAFAHSTFLSGGSVITAGKLTVDAAGKIQEISNHTGHYRSGKAELEIANKIFQEQGVSIPQKGIHNP